MVQLQANDFSAWAPVMLLNGTRGCPSDEQESQTLNLQICSGEMKAVLFAEYLEGDWEAMA